MSMREFYLRLSKPVRLRIQSGILENFLRSNLRCNWFFEEVRAQNFVSAFKEYIQYDNSVYYVRVG